VFAEGIPTQVLQVAATDFFLSHVSLFRPPPAGGPPEALAQEVAAKREVAIASHTEHTKKHRGRRHWERRGIPPG